MKTVDLYTHNGRFHADDVFATAYIKELYGKLYPDQDFEFAIHRVKQVPEGIENDPDNNIWVYDIGEGKYDHHIKNMEHEEDYDKICSAQKIWLDTKDIWTENEQERMEKIIDPVNAKDIYGRLDCGPDEWTVFDKTVITVGYMNREFNEEESQDEMFQKAVDFASRAFQEVRNPQRDGVENDIHWESRLDKNDFERAVINLSYNREFAHENAVEEANRIIAEESEKQNAWEKEYLILDEWIPFDRKKSNIAFFIYPSEREGWNVNSVDSWNYDIIYDPNSVRYASPHGSFVAVDTLEQAEKICKDSLDKLPMRKVVLKSDAFDENMVILTDKNNASEIIKKSKDFEFNGTRVEVVEKSWGITEFSFDHIDVFYEDASFLKDDKHKTDFLDYVSADYLFENLMKGNFVVKDSLSGEYRYPTVTEFIDSTFGKLYDENIEHDSDQENSDITVKNELNFFWNDDRKSNVTENLESAFDNIMEQNFFRFCDRSDWIWCANEVKKRAAYNNDKIIPFYRNCMEYEKTFSDETRPDEDYEWIKNASFEELLCVSNDFTRTKTEAEYDEDVKFYDDETVRAYPFDPLMFDESTKFFFKDVDITDILKEKRNSFMKNPECKDFIKLRDDVKEIFDSGKNPREEEMFWRIRDTCEKTLPSWAFDYCLPSQEKEY